MGDYYETGIVKETCVLVGVISGRQSREQVEEYLDELAFLAETAHAVCLNPLHNPLIIHIQRPLLGKGRWRKYLLMLLKTRWI